MSRSALKGVQAAAGAGDDLVYAEDVFSTYLYDGNGSTQTITNGIDLSGDGGMVWLKGRYEIGNTSNSVTGTIANTVRGATKFSYDELTAAEGTNSGHITQFNSDGFNVGSYSLANSNNMRMCAWSFRKQPGFFDVQTYTGTGSAQTVSHDLACKPGLVIVKRLDSSSAWGVYGRNGANDSEIGIGYLNQNSAFTTSGITFTCTSSSVTIYSSSFSFDATASGGTFVVYFFAMGGTDNDARVFGEDSDESIIACGAYSGNGSTTGPVINLGWEPQWIMVKASNDTSNWTIMDTMRGIVTGGNDAILSANNSTAENSSSYNYVKVTPTGFQPENTNTAINASSYEYIYMAIRRPNKPASEFAATALLGLDKPTSGGKPTPGFPADFGFAKNTTGAGAWYVGSRLTSTNYNNFNTNNAESNASGYSWDSMTQFFHGYSWADYMTYGFRRAPGFMDVVTYTGVSSSTVVKHNLGVVPEMVWRKRRDSSSAWYVWASVLSGAGTAQANGNFYNSDTSGDGSGFSSGQYYSGDTQFDNITPATATEFTQGVANVSTATYVTYLFASVTGISKIGTYTGTGNDLNVDCGFSAGARFVLIKRSDASGGWYVWDSVRGIVAGNDPYFLFNSQADDVTNTDYIDPLSSGFTVTSSAPDEINASGGTYLFYAIA